MTNTADHNIRPDYDELIQTIADYVLDYQIESELAFTTARYCLMDTLGCGILALNYPACTKLLGPIVKGTTVENGARVPGCNYQLDPVQAAFNIGAMIRWLDFNDTWLAAEWGHPSDNLGGILAVADYLARVNHDQQQPPLTMQTVLEAMIKAHEIQGVLALNNSLNRVGLDHVAYVKIATTAVVTKLLGGNREQLLAAISNAFVDGQSLRTYRHAPNAGSRKSWAAGDATSRGVRLAMLAMLGEPGYPSAITAKTWGFQDVLFKGKPIMLERPLGSYVMENVLFKIAFPAEFHAQTAVECAMQLHPIVNNKFDQIKAIKIETHESAVRIISKTGPLHNPADRDHCLQYMLAIGLIYAELTADHYEDQIAQNPLIDQLRDLMQVSENAQYSRDYLDPEKRSIANSVQIEFNDGSMSDKVSIEYPIGHKRRRQEGIPVLLEKFQRNLLTQFDPMTTQTIFDLCQDSAKLNATAVDTFMDHWVIN